MNKLKCVNKNQKWGDTSWKHDESARKMTQGVEMMTEESARKCFLNVHQHDVGAAQAFF